MDGTKNQRSFSERFRSKPENAARAAAQSKARVGRSVQPFIKLHTTQLQRLIVMNDPPAFMLFVILLAQNFIYRGASFELPVQGLLQINGMTDQTALQALLRKLELADLISIAATRVWVRAP